ncbi:metal-dependent transcriptional regulator [Halovivax limisalsi]|uniref:metal-dependent transcriptional regulator n=1 Tax=Halovivax limisalsi TaxID=1453760 RepID=UPI001FFC621A|nr:metal-dependent transcriptional regulator [Halovivax limisalsi]
MEADTRAPGRTDRPAAIDSVGRREARYLYAIADESTGRDGRVTTGDLRAAVGVTPASASQMLSKLGERGLLDREKYRGVRLTERGEAVAARVAWRVCVVSSYFESALEDDLDDERTFDLAVALPPAGLDTLRDRVETDCPGVCPEADTDGGEACPAC